jgi:hypothetical protein
MPRPVGVQFDNSGADAPQPGLGIVHKAPKSRTFVRAVVRPVTSWLGRIGRGRDRAERSGVSGPQPLPHVLPLVQALDLAQP